MHAETIYKTTGLAEGQILGEKYRVEKILGTGGMGFVAAAHHLQLDERVAIKFLLPELLDHKEAVARFAREARAAVKIKSEHVARVIDVGSLPSGAPYMVMEYLEGGDLAAWIKQKGALSVEQAVEFGLQAGEAIAEAHSLGITHRDLKPANLFVVRRADGVSSVKVLDFGISKTGSGLGITRTTDVMGSPSYMSPEQMEASRAVDARTDIWSLGIVLYELLTGNVPYSGDSLPEVCLKIVSQPPPSLMKMRPDLPPGIEQVIFRCLEKDRERRYGNVGELALALAPFGPPRARASVDRIGRVVLAAGLPASQAGFAVETSGSSPSIPNDTLASWGQTGGRSRGGKRIVVGIVLGGAALIGGAAIALRPNPASSEPSGSGHAAEPPPNAAPTAAPPVAPTAAAPPTAAAAVAAPTAATPPSEPASAPSPPAAEPAAQAGPAKAVQVGRAPRAAARAEAARPTAKPAKPAAPSGAQSPPSNPPSGNVFDNRKW